MLNNDKNIIDLRKIQPQDRVEKQDEEKEYVGSEEAEWQTEEFEYHHKDATWFFTIGIVLLGLFVSLIILKNIFGAATMLLFVVIIYIYATKKPDIISAKVNHSGVSINNKLISYSNISSFWIIYEPPIKQLILVVKSTVALKTIIPIGDADPVKIREILIANSVPEKEEEESLTEIIFRKLKF